MRSTAGDPPWVVPAMTWLFGVTAFILLAALARSNDHFPADLWVSRQVQGLDAEWFGRAASFAYYLTTPPYIFGILLPAYVLLRTLYNGHRQALMLLVVPIGAVLTSLAKDHWVDRPATSLAITRGVMNSSGESFPSAPAITAILTFGLLLYFSLGIKRAILRIPLQVFCLYAIVFTGLNRIYEGASWLSDVYGALLLGALILAVLIFADIVWLARESPSDEPLAEPESHAI
jgi:membrane-associated phospholipid phosphatase